MPMTSLGKLQTGETQARDFSIYGFAGGLNVKDVGQMLDDSDLTIATNGYLTTAGGFQMRNGMTTYIDVAPGAALPVILARFYQGVQNGATVSPETVFLLGQYNGSLYKLYTAGVSLVGSIGGSTAQAMTWTRFQNPNDPHYTSGLTDCMVICTGVGGPYVYDGVNLYTPAGWSAASGAQWCAIVNGILWFGGIPAYPNQIFGSGDGITASMETLPAYRNFVMSNPVMGLCASGVGATAFLVVGLNTGVAVLLGTGPSNFYEQELPLNDGVAAGRTMVAWNGNVYFLGRNAVYMFNPNSNPVQISQKVEPWILNSPFVTGPPLGYPMAHNRNLSWACVYNNRLHIGYCSQLTTPDTILVYDLIVNGWTVLTPTPGIASMILLDAPGDPSPYQCLVGTSTTATCAYWDVVPSIGTNATDLGAPVLAQVQTKYFKLGVPGVNKSLQRFYPEFYVTGAFDANFTLGTNYGYKGYVTIVAIEAPSGGAGVWDQSQWDNSEWGSSNAFVPLGPGQVRVDYPGVQADSFAFGVAMTQPTPPWIFAGGSGVYNLRGRT